MTTYDLYGVFADDLDDARRKVELALGLSLNAHESGYHCGDYYRSQDVGNEHFILQKNYDAFEGEWTEPDFQHQPFLLYINETKRAGMLQKVLLKADGFELLRHQEL